MMEEKILAKVDELSQEMIDTIIRMVQIDSVEADSRFDGRSVTIFLVWGDGWEDTCTLSFQTESQAVVSLGTEDGFRIYHPTDPEAHAALANYLEAHGVSDGTSPSQPLSD